jgi:enamine deaminase RidA (YjgF/YER057c/UK114 family)
MSGKIEKRLGELSINLPKPALPVASYSAFILTNNLLFISGQGPLKNGNLITGKVGLDLSLQEGQKAARACGEMILSQAKFACDDLDKIKRCVKLGGFVNCEDTFTDHALVIEGASQLMIDLFGDSGWHSRFAVGANSLPLGMAVEIDAIFEIHE